MKTYKLIQLLKRDHDNRDTFLPIGTPREIRGYLRPVRSNSADALKLSQWRNENFRSFFSWICPDEYEVLNWLENYQQNVRDIIFVIETLSERSVGQLSLYNIDISTKSAEFGRVIKDKTGCGHDLMQDAGISLLRWGYRTLELENIFLEVFSENFSAIAYYKRLGFSVLSIIRKKKSITDQGIIRWEDTDEITGGSSTGEVRQAVRMVIRKDDFTQRAGD